MKYLLRLVGFFHAVLLLMLFAFIFYSNSIITVLGSTLGFFILLFFITSGVVLSIIYIRRTSRSSEKIPWYDKFFVGVIIVNTLLAILFTIPLWK